MAGSDASLATGARIEVDLEGVLLTLARFRQRNQVLVQALAGRELVSIMATREALDRGQILLHVQELTDERQPDARLFALRCRQQCCRLHRHSAGRASVVGVSTAAVSGVSTAAASGRAKRTMAASAAEAITAPPNHSKPVCMFALPRNSKPASTAPALPPAPTMPATAPTPLGLMNGTTE
jgi:hypothetical protein